MSSLTHFQGRNTKVKFMNVRIHVGSDTNWMQDPDQKKIIPDPQHCLEVLVLPGILNKQCDMDPS